MADLTLGDILRVTAKMHFTAGSAVQNVYNLQFAQSSDPSQEAVADDIGEYLENAYSEVQGRMTNQLIFDEYTVIDVDLDLDVGTSGWPSLTTGGDVGDPLPAQLAGLVKFKTNFGKHQGRKYLGVFTETDNSGGYPTVGLQTDLADFGTAVAGLFYGSSGNGYIYKVYDQVTELGLDVSLIVVPGIWGSQRRRRFGVGI